MCTSGTATRIFSHTSVQYIFVWICLLASLNLAARWKAQQALQFANTPQRRAASPTNAQSYEDEDDEVDDDDAFEDAHEDYE